METGVDKEQRMAALCKSLGNLWTKDLVADISEEWPANKLHLCDLTLLGKLYSNPNINVQAFVSTMQKAWKTEDFVCDQHDQGIFSFTFRSEMVMKRVLDASPWSFSSNLLIIQKMMPKVPIHRHNFTHCAF